MTNSNLNEQKLREILNKNVISKVSEVEKRLIEFQGSFQKTAQQILDDVTQFLTSIEEAALQDLREEFFQYGHILRSQTESELRPIIQQELEPRLRSQLEGEIKAQCETALEQHQLEATQNARKSAHESITSKIGGLNQAIQEISQQKSQVNILTSYINHAACFAPRVAFFVIKSDAAIGWKAFGFEGEYNNESIKTLSFPLGQNDLLQQVCLTQQPYEGTILSHPGVSKLVTPFGQIAPDSICLLPIPVRNKVVAVLYADSGLLPQQPIDVKSLQMLTAVVSMSVELGSMRSKMGVKSPEGEAAHAPGKSQAAAPAFIPPKPEEEKPEAVQPLLPPEPSLPPPTEVSLYPETPEAKTEPKVEVETVSPAAGPAFQEAVQPSEPVTFKAPEPPVKVAIEPPRQEEVPTTVEPVQEPEVPQEVEEKSKPAPPPPSPPSPAPTGFHPGPILTSDMDDTERKLHADAYRFAKLLVTEIKLYNENKVLEGRRGNNLYELLRDDIDRSREMYDKRVNTAVSAKTDYFYNELIRVLGNNNPESLGKDSPGPSILQ
jgi:hypothetical protein